MDGAAWILLGGGALLLTGLLIFVLRRRRTPSDGPDEAMRRARQAIRESGHAQRRQHRGSLRGKGYGGDDGRAYDAGFTSGSDGAP
ncbi:LPXTG-motif cell wall-anchored protein [Micromonospora luteifusca]|uniref:LPXTG-motif cell wall-anchored protein n=1 Tax=Micromonospora luteifusca TaxID=709860 RepID=A0ABS2LZW2_9ACTN|nr:LPXTG cell wall anchor domain-containing protein [Micromonospora luteifusca]MBM7493696.1 LPXTG-motif cell wall-anchored protein [Micromonospora luteifusca]